MRKPRTAKPEASLWLIDNSDQLKLTPADVAKRIGVSESTVRGWEAGRAIGPDSRRSLRELFGSEPPGGDEPPADQSALLAALVDQTAAIRELAQEIRDAFRRNDGRSQARAEEVTRTLARIAETVGVPDEGSGVPASTRTGDVGPDRPPAKHRTTGAPRVRPGRSRPSWEELREAVEEARTS